MESFLKKTGWESIVTSIIFAIVGVLLICNPEGTFKIAATVLGIVLIVTGLIKVMNYFVDKGSSDFYNYKLIYGLIAVVAGIVIIVYSGALGTFFRVAIGLWIIYSGIMRLALATKLKTVDEEVWKTVLAIALIMILFGLFVTFYSGAIGVTIGILILTYAIMDLVEGVIFVKNVDKVFKD